MSYSSEKYTVTTTTTTATGGGAQVVLGQPTTHVTTILDLTPVRKWDTQIMGCCSDVKTCCYGLFCYPCMSCDVSYSLDEWTWVICCCPSLPQMRSKERYLLRIEGSACGDVCCGILCGLCAHCQMYRELKSQGLLRERACCDQLCQKPGDKVCKC